MAIPWTIIIIITMLQHTVSLTDHLWSRTFLSYAAFNTTGSRKITSEYLHSCPAECECNEGFEIVCSARGLTNFPLNLETSLLNLNLAQNHIFNLTYGVSLSALKILNASQNTISEINKKWLLSLENLQTLDLSKNFLDSKTIESTFQNPLLSCLNLSHNRLHEISAVMFDKASALVILDLSHNEIQDIDLEAFESQSHLEIIDLSSNKLVEVKHGWFKSLKKLEVLHLKNNYLIFLRNVAFWPLNNLKILDLSKNAIVSTSSLSFKGLTNLEILNISNNNISHMQGGVFRSLESIKIMDLSQNSFESTDKIFLHTHTLDTLYMKKLYNFKILTSFSFQGLKQLRVLDLSGSQLSEVNRNGFKDMVNLKEIDLSNLQLQNIKMGTFSNLHKVEVLKLNGNPWTCDCYMYWIILWLGEHSNTHLLSSTNTLCESPQNLQGQNLLDALDHSMVCTNAFIPNFTVKTKFKVGSTAFLKCEVEGSPTPSLMWITPQKGSFQWYGPQNYTSSASSGAISDGKTKENGKKHRFYLMSNGNLAITNVNRGDGGFYECIASNPLSNYSVSIRLTLDYSFLRHVKIVSILVGIATSFGFLLLTLISVLVKMILKHFKVKCSCRKGNHSPRSQQIKKILESMEHYKKQQLDRLHDNYNGQVQRIKDNCMQQMERLRESYSSQAERLRDIRDYGTLQIDRIRENYYFQVQRVRDYSNNQIMRLRENYLFQRNRIRKFSAQHLYKLRENYKLQQQHLNKILENLNIENCRNVCQRTDSIVFESDITLENVLVPKICLQSFAKEACDSIDSASQISAYFTPDEVGSEVSEHENDDYGINSIIQYQLNQNCSINFTKNSLELETAKRQLNNIPQSKKKDTRQPETLFRKSKSESCISNVTVV